MARGAINTYVSDRDGTLLGAETDGDATNGHYLQNSGKTKFTARNSGASARIVTIHVAKTVAGQAVTSITKSVPAGEIHIFGPYSVADFGSQVLIDVAHAEVKLRGIE